PYDSKWLIELAKVYSQAGDKSRLVETLEKLVHGDPDDLDHRKRLASLCLDTGRPAAAERYAREALEIEVRDVEARDYLEKAYRAQENKQAELEQLRAVFAR